MAHLVDWLLLDTPGPMRQSASPQWPVAISNHWPLRLPHAPASGASASRASGAVDRSRATESASAATG